MRCPSTGTCFPCVGGHVHQEFGEIGRSADPEEVWSSTVAVKVLLQRMGHYFRWGISLLRYFWNYDVKFARCIISIVARVCECVSEYLRMSRSQCHLHICKELMTDQWPTCGKEIKHCLCSPWNSTLRLEMLSWSSSILVHVHGSQKRTLLELSPWVSVIFDALVKTQFSHGEMLLMYRVSVSLLAIQLHHGKIVVHCFPPPFSRVLPRKDLEKPFFSFGSNTKRHKNDQRLPTHTQVFEDAVSGDLVMKGLANFHPADSWTTKKVQDIRCAYACL